MFIFEKVNINYIVNYSLIQKLIMPKKTPYQKFVIKYLFEMFKTTSMSILSMPGIKIKIIYSMVRHYPEITSSGSLTYTNFVLLKKHFKWSERAVHTSTDSAGSVHTEHIVPVSDCMLRLYALPLNFTIRDLIRIFDDYQIIKKGSSAAALYSVDDVIVKLRYNGDLVIDNSIEQIVISKQEKDVLDGSKGKLYPLTDPFPPYSTKMEYGAGLRSSGSKIDRLRGGYISYDLSTIKNSL